MEAALRAALIAWLRANSALMALINSVAEEAPFTAEPPWLAISASAATDWSTKTEPGAEVRIQLTLSTRNDQASGDMPILNALDAAVRSLPAAQPGFTLASVFFLKSRAAQKTPATRATVLEYRFRIQAG